MSDREDDENPIRNEETLRRRAWVNRAIEIVRQRLEVPERKDGGAQEPKRPAALFVIRPTNPR